MPKGFLIILLHAHLPYVRHVEHPHFLEERWFLEAITECYIPIIEMMDRLTKDGVPFKFTMSLTPTLLSMLADPLLQERYINHISRQIELAEKEIARVSGSEKLSRLAKMYHGLFSQARRTFCDTYHKNLNNAFRKFMELGNLEIITSGATHGYFPLMENSRKSVKAQVAVGVKSHEFFLGKRPAGIWLPECGYFPGDDFILNDYGIKYFFTDTHGILYASPRPRYAVFAPVFCPSGVAAFARDPESSKQVWSSSEGYPGDYDYREYYRDIGFDLDFGYIWPYIHPEGIRVNTGIKYYRITGKNVEKQLYDPAIAAEKAARHARDFLDNRRRQANFLGSMMDRLPVMVSPYDAELFGHWWFEGPRFLEELFRAAAGQKDIRLITPPEYLSIYPHNQITQLCQSSWGNNGYHEVWLEGSNQWIYRHLHQAADRMSEMAIRFPQAAGIMERTLNQAARELLLAQASDWAFIMKTGSMVDYAIMRTKRHLDNFHYLSNHLNQDIDSGYLARLEEKNNIFPFMDYNLFA